MGSGEEIDENREQEALSKSDAPPLDPQRRSPFSPQLTSTAIETLAKNNPKELVELLKASEQGLLKEKLTNEQTRVLGIAASVPIVFAVFGYAYLTGDSELSRIVILAWGGIIGGAGLEKFMAKLLSKK